MRNTLLLATTLTVLLVTQTGCGTTGSTAGDGAPPPTTVPDEVDPPTSPPLEPPGPSTPPTTGAPDPTVPTPSAPTPPTPAPPGPVATLDLVIDDGSFGSVAEMGDVASLVVVGEVVATTSLGRPFADRDPSAHEFVAITVRTLDTLKGTPTGELILAWQAYATDADGERTATLLTNGLRPPEVADRLLLFLDPADPATAEVLGGAPTHQLVKLDGIAYLDGDRVIATEIGSPTAEQLAAMELSAIRDAVAG